jgi:hypothetical protein
VVFRRRRPDERSTEERGTRCPQASSHSPESQPVTYPRTSSVGRYYGPLACHEENRSVTSGPGEILQHCLTLLLTDSDVNRRLAMIAIDNAVELTMKTYLELPEADYEIADTA